MKAKIPIQLTFELSAEKQASYLALLTSAQEAKEKAYAPYSGYKGGAALLAKDGTIISGCNVENASYGLTMCAERTSIFTAVAQGYKPGDFEAIAVAANRDNFSPCGACRQVINEFGEQMAVIFEFKDKIVIACLKDILPFNFVL
ncbi:MAG TPA: cytidine deaminase [Saprospiraceae bacterium]|nr:cytidine deaminase [Saprospiraceae bacterium]